MGAIVRLTKEEYVAMITCPHCKKKRIPRQLVPNDVIVVLRCPLCHEWIILFRDKVIGVSRRILEHGSIEEKKNHLAEVIAHLLESGIEIFPKEPAAETWTEEEEINPDPAITFPLFRRKVPSRRRRGPITNKEFEKFVQVELNALDDPEYFKKHFQS
jgi:hypothetical protein